MPITINGNGTVTGISAGGLPSGSLTLTGSDLPTGSIIQTVHFETTTGVEITDTTWTDTNLTANITPSSASHKILVLVSQYLTTHRNTNTAYGGLKLLRDTTDISHDYYAAFGIRADGDNDRWWRGYVSFNILDSPNTTSQITYKTQARDHLGSDGAEIKPNDDSMQSTLTLLEVRA